MSFRGKVVGCKKIGPVELVTTEYPTPKRRKTIWWMGESKVCMLGKLVTSYMAEPRKSDFEEIKWKAFYYEVKLNKNADATKAVEMYGEDPDFDDLEEAEEFIELVKCKLIRMGGINIGTNAEYKRWASINLLEEVK